MIVPSEPFGELIRALLEGRVGILNSYSLPVARALGYLAAHVHETFKTEDVAAQASVSRSHLYRLFRQEVGLSPLQVLTLLRLEKSRRLLASRRFTVTDVWQASGFSDLRTFERAFKRWLGCTPREYQKRLRGKTAPTEN